MADTAIIVPDAGDNGGEDGTAAAVGAAFASAAVAGAAAAEAAHVAEEVSHVAEAAEEAEAAAENAEAAALAGMQADNAVLGELSGLRAEVGAVAARQERIETLLETLLVEDEEERPDEPEERELPDAAPGELETEAAAAPRERRTRRWI
jgi:hypothetical protein